ncbi:MAG: hypothetical protein N3J91_02580 [Verrucomicrobiae bacterium]|nr:hypothetical protein [Verrucomicrobiae bacterium]
MPQRSFHSWAGITLGLAAVFLGCLLGPCEVTAADSPAKTTPPAGAATTAKRNPPFVGVVQKVDVQAGTVTLNGKEGGRVFYVTSETRITKNGQPATLKDARVGEEAAGTFTDKEGRRYAVSLRLGPKPEATTTPKK